MTDRDSAAIVIKGLSFSYDGYPVLEDVNLSIPQGDFVSVVGPNGGGKTTLLKLVVGLLRPSRGEVRVFGAPPQQARPYWLYAPAVTIGSAVSCDSHGCGSYGASWSWLAVRTILAERQTNSWRGS